MVIGAAIADSLFPHTDPIGKEVRLDGRLYEVIGVFERDPGLFGGFGVDKFACIPLSNYHKNFPQVREIFLVFTVREDADLDTVRDQVIEAMRRRRQVPHNAENDFDVADPNFFTALWNQLTGAMALLTGVISSIGLLVGGIGVMNIMLISVTERTGEIGIRKAIGARKSDIRVQFLLEAVTLSGIGGVLGILVGGADLAGGPRAGIDSGHHLAVLGGDGGGDLGQRGAVFRILPREPGREPGSDCVSAVRVRGPQ